MNAILSSAYHCHIAYHYRRRLEIVGHELGEYYLASAAFDEIDISACIASKHIHLAIGRHERNWRRPGMMTQLDHIRLLASMFVDGQELT